MMRTLTNNLSWKLLALLCASVLWLVIVRDPELATTVSVPVLFRGAPKNLEINSELVQRVQLEIRGASGRLTPANLSKAAVILDLGSVNRPGDRTYNIEASNVSLPSGVLFTGAVPSQIRLHFERRVSRQVPVRVRYSNPPPEGYRLVNQTVTPEKLPIVGPESNVEQIGFVDTDSIDLSNVVGPAEFQVNTYVPDPRVRFEGSPHVTVRVTVQKIPQ